MRFEVQSESLRVGRLQLTLPLDGEVLARVDRFGLQDHRIVQQVEVNCRVNLCEECGLVGKATRLDVNQPVIVLRQPISVFNGSLEVGRLVVGRHQSAFLSESDDAEVVTRLGQNESRAIE